MGFTAPATMAPADGGKRMRKRSMWIGLAGVLAVSSGAAHAATRYCPKIVLPDGMSVEIIRIDVYGEGQETFTARWRSADPKGSLWGLFDVSNGTMDELSQIRLAIDDRALPPHGVDRPLTAVLRIKDAPPWRAQIRRALPAGYRLDEFRIDADSHTRLASEFVKADAAELTVTTQDGAAAVTLRFPLPPAEDWAAMRKRVAETMAAVEAGTCDVVTWTAGSDLKEEAPPPLIVASPPLPRALSR